MEFNTVVRSVTFDSWHQPDVHCHVETNVTSKVGVHVSKTEEFTFHLQFRPTVRIMYMYIPYLQVMFSVTGGNKRIYIYIPRNSDNFSFQNNGIKKCTCWKTMGFFGKQWVFLKQCFLTRLFDAWFILIIKHVYFIKIKMFYIKFLYITQLFFPKKMCVKNAKRRPKIITAQE